MLLIFLAGCTSLDLVDDPELEDAVEFRLEGQENYLINNEEFVKEIYTFVNPTSGNIWEFEVYRIDDEEVRPAVILIPGGINGMDAFNEKSFSALDVDYTPAEKFASEGFVVLIFNPEGRGNSEGEEDYNGYIDQDGLHALYNYLKARKDVNEEKIGFISYSYGVAMVSGMLGRYQVPALFYIEWEGPVNRDYVTVGCKGVNHNYDSAIRYGISCSDDDYWSEREALTFVPDFKVKNLQIVQSSEDHVQANVQHSVDMNNLAIQYLDSVKVNDGEINAEYSVDTLPTIEEDNEVKYKIIEYAKGFVE